MLSACTGSKSDKVTSLQKRDKLLSCKEVQLEINEAEFYRQTAEKNKGPNVRNIMMPLGYVSTYMSAEEAIDASDARVDYLNRIYAIMDCDNPKSEGNLRQPAMNMNIVPQGGGGGSALNVMAVPQQNMYNRDGGKTQSLKENYNEIYWYY